MPWFGGFDVALVGVCLGLGDLTSPWLGGIPWFGDLVRRFEGRRFGGYALVGG
jgi:hypothetical protein